MINYKPRDWFTFLFRFHKDETVRRLAPMLVTVALYSALICYLELAFVFEGSRQLLKNLPMLHTTLAFVISLLLVFRTNTAYDRWWEGRRLWGSLVNNTRNLAAKLDALLPESERDVREFFRTLIPAFAVSLRTHLQAESTRTALVPDEGSHPVLNRVDQQRHVPNQIASLLTSRLVQLHREGKVSGEELLFVNPELSSLIDICGACERIKNTPIPFSYSAFIKKVIFFYVMTLPVGYVFSLGYYAVPVSVFIFYILASLELVAEEIEDPFGGDANDLPTDAISKSIGVHVRELLSGHRHQANAGARKLL